MRQILTLIILISVAACQSRPSYKSAQRSVANTTVMRVFITEVAEQSQRYAARELQNQVESRLVQFLREGADESNQVGNWVRMGITKEQAMQVNGLYDDLPYMNKVQKWVMENFTTLMSDIRPSMARNAYSKVLGESGSLYDPYMGMSDDLQNALSGRRNQTMPPMLRRNTPEVTAALSISEEIQRKNTRLMAATETIKEADANAVQNIRANLNDISDDLLKNNPLVASNINHSVEGSIIITKKTGRSSMGPGCVSFNENASAEIIEMKARVDIRRAELVEERAYEKAGKVFDTVDEVPVAQRLSQKELDEITEQAFADVLGYTRTEARAAIRRLKSPPCRIY